MAINYADVEPPSMNPENPCDPIPPDQIVWKRTGEGKLHIDAGGEGKHPEANNLNWMPTVHGGGGGPSLEHGDPIPNLVCANILSTWPIGDRQVDLVTVEGSPLNAQEIARVIKDGGKIIIIPGGLSQHPELVEALGARVAAVNPPDVENPEKVEIDVKP